MVMNATLPRITARVDNETQELLAKAAALAGMSSINSFVLSAAIEKAQLVIDRDLTLKLSERDALRLAEALDRPAEVHPKLKAAAQRYQQQSRA